jgi:hypothetical protein
MLVCTECAFEDFEGSFGVNLRLQELREALIGLDQEAARCLLLEQLDGELRGSVARSVSSVRRA